MHIKMLEFEIDYSKKVSIFDLRSLVLEHISHHGEPLRWSITEVEDCRNDPSSRHLKVESMLIVS